ncbi:MAG: hypothetical protein LBS84_03170 [Clostridiales bacterium]|nr:hypothetical protein [Clostridiales bacterium]
MSNISGCPPDTSPAQSAQYREKERNARDIRKDIAAARAIIESGLARYKKKKLRARSLKQAEGPNLFAELEPYESKQEIQEAFGWGYISDTEMHRLWDMWDARENAAANNGKYSDRVTQMLEQAIWSCGSIFEEELGAFEDLQRQARVKTE